MNVFACICVRMSELKREDRLIHTCVCVCIYACPVMYDYFSLLS